MYSASTVNSQERVRNKTDVHIVADQMVDGAREGRMSSTRMFLADNRFSLLGAGWVTAMAASLHHSFSGGRAQRYSVMQNLIHARVKAQAFTIAALLLMAIVAPIEAPKDQVVMENGWQVQVRLVHTKQS